MMEEARMETPGTTGMDDEKTKKLGLMRFWLFGAFVIVIVAATVYVGGAIGTGLAILRELNYWIAVVVTGALCAIWYFGYKAWLNRS
jgi:hypothetical protein